MTTKEYPFKAFVFEGAGATAFGHFGAVEKFSEKGDLSKIKYFCGSSSGSMIASVLACGASLIEVKQELLQTDFNNFLDDSNGIIPDVYRLFSKWGWYKGEFIEEWFGNFLQKTIGNKNLTFKELFDKTGNTLIITAVDITTGTLLYQGKDTTPDFPIKKAMRRSTSLPLVYKPDVIQEGEILKYYIDGGCLDNYPIRIFDNILKPEEVVGFKILNSYGEDQDDAVQKIKTPPTSLFDFTARFLSMMIQKNNAIHVPEADWQRTVKIKVGKYSSLNFDINLHDKRVMIDAGKVAMEKFLEKN